MALNKKGLGRGLDALLDPYSEGIAPVEQGVMNVSVLDIDTNAAQPRKSFDEESLKELAASISVHGIVQPLIVKKKRGRYLIVAGERRFRAARIAGLSTVPVILVNYEDAKLQEVSLIENIQRENLNPIEEASAIRFLMTQHDMTQEEVSDRIGKSRPAVANSLRLLSLPPEVIDRLKDGTLSAGHGRALAGLPDEQTQKSIALEAVRLGYSVRALESRIKNLNEKGTVRGKRKETPLSADLASVEETFRERLGTKVKISGTEKKGKVTIEYYSADDLQRIYDAVVK